MDLLEPEYNILKKAGSLLGFKHNESTLNKFKNRTVSESTRNNLSLAATNRTFFMLMLRKQRRGKKKNIFLSTRKTTFKGNAE